MLVLTGFMMVHVNIWDDHPRKCVAGWIVITVMIYGTVDHL